MFYQLNPYWVDSKIKELDTEIEMIDKNEIDSSEVILFHFLISEDDFKIRFHKFLRDNVVYTTSNSDNKHIFMEVCKYSQKTKIALMKVYILI